MQLDTLYGDPLLDYRRLVRQYGGKHLLQEIASGYDKMGGGMPFPNIGKSQDHRLSRWLVLPL